mgnify:CR=1 FL=1
MTNEKKTNKIKKIVLAAGESKRFGNKNKLSVLSPIWIEYSIVEYAVYVKEPVNTETKRETKILQKPTVL